MFIKQKIIREAEQSQKGVKNPLFGFTDFKDAMLRKLRRNLVGSSTWQLAVNYFLQTA
jgi:hypothetical protein